MHSLNVGSSNIWLLCAVEGVSTETDTLILPVFAELLLNLFYSSDYRYSSVSTSVDSTASSDCTYVGVNTKNIEIKTKKA